MNFEELLQFAKEESVKLSSHYKMSKSDQVMPNMLKLVEEVGELSEEILKEKKLQRKEKLAKATPGVGNELADVIITLLILAESLNVNIDEALEEKTIEIRKYWKE